MVGINYGIDESAPLLKFSTETDKHYAVSDLAALVNVGALTPDSELEAFLRAEGDLPEHVEDEESPDDGEEEPVPLRPAARRRTKASISKQPQNAMTVGGRTLTRNPLPP